MFFFVLFCPLQYSENRLLCPLHPGLPFLWISHSVQYGGGSGLVRHLHIRSLLLLLLRRRPGRRLQLPLWHGLWHYGCMLWVFGLPGDLHGVLRNLFPNIKAQMHAGNSQDRCWARKSECVCVCEWELLSVFFSHLWKICSWAQDDHKGHTKGQKSIMYFTYPRRLKVHTSIDIQRFIFNALMYQSLSYLLFQLSFHLFLQRFLTCFFYFQRYFTLYNFKNLQMLKLKR